MDSVDSRRVHRVIRQCRCIASTGMFRAALFRLPLPQYAAGPYQQMLSTYSITASMSRKGNCWDNAYVESFFGTLKRELVCHRHYATRDEAKQDIFEYIEVFYNRTRRHSTLGYDSPAEYEARAAVA